MPPLKETRKKKYPEVKRHAGDITPIDIQGMKELMGYTLDKDEAKADAKAKGYPVPKDGPFPLFKDRAGKSVYFTNNQTNRPFDPNIVEGLVQEKHNGRFHWNGEPMLIGWFGSVLGGQHNGAAHILAEQDREADPAKFGETPYTWAKDVVYGISEDDEVVDTIDTCRARDETDVMYRSKLFRNKKPSERLEYAKVFAGSIKFLFDRTGASNKSMNPHAHMRTITGAVEFADRHPTLLKLLEHIITESGGNPIAFTPLGIATGMSFLMASSATNGEDYRSVSPPTEKGRKGIDFANLDLAKEFVVLLCENAKASENSSLAAIKQAIAAGHKDGDITYPMSTKEKCAIWAHAWALFLEKPKGTIEKKQLKLKYRTNEKGIECLDDFPCFEGKEGTGIDLGPLAAKYKPETEDADDTLNAESNGELDDAVSAELMKLSKGMDKAKLKAKNRVLLYKNGKPGVYFVKGEDAEIVMEALNIKDSASLPDGPIYISVSAEDDAALKEVAQKIAESGEIGVSVWNGKGCQKLAEAPVVPEEVEEEVAAE